MEEPLLFRYDVVRLRFVKRFQNILYDLD